jgi:hypothetical protein
MKLKKTNSDKIEKKLKTVSKNLKTVSNHAILVLDALENKRISLDQARVAQRLIADTIRAEISAAMIDNQIMNLKENKKTIDLKTE